MSRVIYSKHFTTQQGLNGHGPTILVPAGHVYVVKQLTMFADPLLATARAHFRDLDSGATLFSNGTNAGQPLWSGFFGTLVFEAGMSFRWEASAVLTDGVDVSASGYDLIA